MVSGLCMSWQGERDGESVELQKGSDTIHPRSCRLRFRDKGGNEWLDSYLEQIFCRAINVVFRSCPIASNKKLLMFM
jgi:hypothetical protein